MKAMNAVYAQESSRFKRSVPAPRVDAASLDDDIPPTAENLMLAGAVAHYLRSTFMLNHG